jgi:hypothetical protein
MTAPTITAGHAKYRHPVRLPDGRTGRLLYVPAPRGRRRRTRQRPGAMARVTLPSGAVVGAPVDLLVLVDEVTP